jgi:hypothetical protein
VLDVYDLKDYLNSYLYTLHIVSQIDKLECKLILLTLTRLEQHTLISFRLSKIKGVYTYKIGE